jgi:prevent-host-death family protein
MYIWTETFTGGRPMTTVSTVKAREAFSEMLNRSAFGKERIVLTRRGKGVAAIIPLEDLALVEAAEERQDAEEIRRRVKDWERGGRKTIPLEEVAKAHRGKV